MLILHTDISTPIRSGGLLATIPLPLRRSDAGSRITLVLQGFQKTERSLVLEVSLVLAGRTSFLCGYLYTYGEGPVVEPDIRGRFVPITLTLDLTDAVAQAGFSGPAELRVRILDAHDRELNDEQIVLQSVEVTSGPIA